MNSNTMGTLSFFFNVCNTDVQDVTNVVPSTSWHSLNHKKFGPPATKIFSLWLDCWGEISQVLWKAKHENILWDCSSFWEGECALQSQGCREYFVSLANVVCRIWSINQTLTASSGKQSVRWRRARRAPSKWHLGEKEERGKNNERNVYGAGMILLTFILKVWKFVLIRVGADAGGKLNQCSLLPCHVWFMLGIWQPLSSETFQNLLFNFLSKANELFFFFFF